MTKKTAKSRVKSINKRSTTTVKTTSKARAKVMSKTKVGQKTSKLKIIKNHTKSLYHMTPKFIHGMVVGAFVGIVTVASLGLGRGAEALSISSVKDCDSWSIINCGVTSTNDLNNKYDSSAYVRNVYSNFGISAAEINSMGKTAVKGMVYNNGDVKVNGKVVATNVKTAARKAVTGGDNVKVTVNGSTFYNRHLKTAWSHTFGPAYVVFDKNGVFEFAILASCGNPLVGTPKPPQPELACQSLTYSMLNKDERIYSFKVSATAKYTTITDYIFHFGDGTTQKVKTSAKTAATKHTYAKSGNRYVIYVVVNSDRKSGVTSSNCKVALTTSTLPPILSCASLSATLLSENERKYQFTVKASATRTKITGYSFNFGDGKVGTVRSSKSSVTVEHTFTDNASHKITASVSSVDFKNVSSPACSTTVAGVDECKPGIPKGSDECEINITTVSTLPNTGPGALLIILTLSVLGGAIFHKTHHHVRHKRRTHHHA